MANGIWKLENILYYLLILFLPTQLGKHFWPKFSYVLGIRVDYLSPTIYLTDCLVFLLFSVWLFRKVRKSLQNKSKIKDQRSKVHSKDQKHFLYLICVFTFLFLIFNIAISGRILGSLYYLLKVLEIFFVAYYSAKFVTRKNVFQKVVTLFSIGVIFESLLAIFQYFNQGSIGGLLYYLGERTFNSSTPGIANASLNGELVLRPYATFPHPNVLAGYLVIAMILVLFSFKPKENIKEKILKIASLALGTGALILSMSRVAIMVWVLILGYFFVKKITYSSSERSESRSSNLTIKQFNNRYGSRQARTIIILGFVILISIFLFSSIASRFTNISISDEAIVQRRILFEKSFQMLKPSPLLGVGLGNFIPTLATIQKPLTVSTYFQPVHNIFLLVAAETGLIGLAFFTWFLWKTFKMANGKWQMENGILISFLTILTLGLFDHYWLTLQQGQLLFAFCIGLFLSSNDNDFFS